MPLPLLLPITVVPCTLIGSHLCMFYFCRRFEKRIYVPLPAHEVSLFAALPTCECILSK